MKNATFMEDASHSPPTNATVSLKRTPCRLFVGLASKPESESIRRCFCLVFTKNQTRAFLVGSEAYKTGSESITHAFAWSSPNLNPETIC